MRSVIIQSRRSPNDSWKTVDAQGDLNRAVQYPEDSESEQAAIRELARETSRKLRRWDGSSNDPQSPFYGWQFRQFPA